MYVRMYSSGGNRGTAKGSCIDRHCPWQKSKETIFQRIHPKFTPKTHFCADAVKVYRNEKHPKSRINKGFLGVLFWLRRRDLNHTTFGL